MKKMRMIPTITLIVALAIGTAVMAGVPRPDSDVFACDWYCDNDGCKDQDHGWLGVEVMDGSIEGIVDIEHGAQIYEVLKGSPAEEAGLLPGDFITQINGRNVTSAIDLINELQHTKPGDRILITTTLINQKGHYRNLDIVVVLTDRTDLQVYGNNTKTEV